MLPVSGFRMAFGLGARVASEGGRGDFLSVSTDTRTLKKGDLFVALQAKRAGEEYFPEALRLGARGLVGRSFSPAVAREAKRRKAWLFAVEDGLRALQALAADERRKLSCPLVAVTGSNGKTSTKDLLALLLGGEGVLATRGNLNNHLGVPLTLLEAREGLRYAVLEAGMNHPGELLALGRILRPDLALELNVGDAHSGHFPDGRKGVARAKEELLRAMGPGGLALVNSDDPATAAMGRRFRGRSVGFGLGKGADLRLVDLDDRGAGGLRATALWKAPLGGRPARVTVDLSQGGPARAAQAAAALAAALSLGLDPRLLERRLSQWKPSGAMRQELRRLKGGATAVLDAYNASPQSMRAALAFLEKSSPKGGRLAVLGCMLELGAGSARLHRLLGRDAKGAGLKSLAVLGAESQAVAEGFGPGAQAFGPDEVEEAAAFVRARLKRGDWCLFKGSRGLAVERVYQALQGA